MGKTFFMNPPPGAGVGANIIAAAIQVRNSGPGGNGGFILEDSSGYILLEDGTFLLLE